MPSDAQHAREFVGLIVRHQTKLRAYIISLMPGVPGVSDVLQETNIVLWEKMKSFEPGTNFTAWAFAIARYEVKAHCRRLHRHKSEVVDSDMAEKMADEISADFSGGRDAIEERIQALRQCMKRLSEDERRLIWHRYMDGTSLAEYARQSGQSSSSLRTVLRRLRMVLRKCVSSRIATERSAQ